MIILVDPRDEDYENEDESTDNEDRYSSPCVNCNGEGITFIVDDDDEQNGDFGQCPVCGGTGEDPDNNDNEEEY